MHTTVAEPISITLSVPFIYVLYISVSTFTGKMITANYVPAVHYNKLFPESIRATRQLRPRE